MPSPRERPTRVLLADDHPVFREGLRTVLAAVPQIEIVGEVATGVAAVSAAAELQPDVVVMDLQMPELNGIEATRQIVRTSPHVGVLVLTMFEDEESLFAAMRVGARGYVLKESGSAGIIGAIQAVADGEAIFGPRLAERMKAYFSAGRVKGGAQPFPALSEREREVLELMARGRDNTGIAHRLQLSPKTVRNHVSTIFTKLQVADRAQAIARAREAGMG